MKSGHMLITPKQQNVDLWEVWVDLQTSHQANTATLYLIGDVFTNDHLTQPYFRKKNHSDPKVLSLEIFPGVASEDGYLAEVMYSEELEHNDQYSAVLIYAGDELITQIQDIELVA